mmetsp:Transcript_21241/g.71441  ORF Transcript_21241/g.71441 Transcript_21241/m.71441 type:complete len:313 (-) Transcript_21241:414-1352(-)
MLRVLCVTALLAAAGASSAPRPTALGQSRVTKLRGGAAAGMVSMVKPPQEAYFAFAEKGAANALLETPKILFQSIIAGGYIGFGGLLALIISSGCTGIKASNPSLPQFIFAALFPVNLLLILLTGGQLFTGNSAAVTAALCEGMVSFKDLVKSWTLSLFGNIVGCGAFAYLAHAAGFLVGNTKEGAIYLATKKVGSSFVQTLLKAIMCNWLVCMAVFLCGAATDMTGKMVGIWFPISAFVAIGCEHSVANLFLLPLGLLADADITLGDVIMKNLIPVTLGNAIAGAVIVGMGYSYAFGALGYDYKKLEGKRK